MIQDDLTSKPHSYWKHVETIISTCFLKISRIMLLYDILVLQINYMYVKER